MYDDKKPYKETKLRADKYDYNPISPSSVIIISPGLLLRKGSDEKGARRVNAAPYQAHFRSISTGRRVGSPVTFEACGPRSRTGRWASQVARLFPRCSEPTACFCPRPRAPAIELCTRPSSSCWCRPGIVSFCRRARMPPNVSRSAPRCPRSLDSSVAPQGVE